GVEEADQVNRMSTQRWAEIGNVGVWNVPFFKEWGGAISGAALRSRRIRLGHVRPCTLPRRLRLRPRATCFSPLPQSRYPAGARRSEFRTPGPAILPQVAGATRALPPPAPQGHSRAASPRASGGCPSPEPAVGFGRRDRAGQAGEGAGAAQLAGDLARLGQRGAVGAGTETHPPHPGLTQLAGCRSRRT